MFESIVLQIARFARLGVVELRRSPWLTVAAITALFLVW